MKLYINIINMKNLRKKNTIFNKLEKSIENLELNNNNLDLYLDDLKISKSDFYDLFPQKITSLGFFYYDQVYLISKNKVKIKILKEKSVSKKTTILLLEFMRSFDKKSRLSVFFLNYSLLKPFFLSKIVYKISSNIWYDIGDESTDFNYYSKRLILYNIIKNSLFYWRKSQNLEQTLSFTERQIYFFGKIGKLKFNTKKFFKENFGIPSS